MNGDFDVWQKGQKSSRVFHTKKRRLAALVFFSHPRHLFSFSSQQSSPLSLTFTVLLVSFVVIKDIRGNLWRSNCYASPKFWEKRKENRAKQLVEAKLDSLHNFDHRIVLIDHLQNISWFEEVTQLLPIHQKLFCLVQSQVEQEKMVHNQGWTPLVFLTVVIGSLMILTMYRTDRERTNTPITAFYATDSSESSVVVTNAASSDGG